MSFRNENRTIKDLLFYLFLLTVFFVLLEISFFIQCNSIYLGDFSLVSSQLHIPSTILPGIFYFIFVQISLHILYCLIVWGVTLSTAYFINLREDKLILFGIIIWILGISTTLLANQSIYPNSKFAELSALIFYNQHMLHIILLVLSFMCCVLFLLSACGFIKMIVYKGFYYIPLILSIVVSSGFTMMKPEISKHTTSLTGRPNIILIGVDSLRPDFLGYFGGQSTPFIDTFLNKSIVFSDAITPLARTFPSWTSILTGQYPKEIGIRFNLAEQEGAELTDTLANILQHHGYETIYATDETRFSNIGKNYGFNHIISPPVGLNDFLLGTFNDFPFSNLLVNTIVGKWLFPYSYANRPVYFTYDPNSFLNLLRSGLQKERTKPLFLAVHFCLTHFPYVWAHLPAEGLNVVERYQASIARIDQQLEDFFTLLKQEHLLDQAIVVLLSDHGEAFELPGDRITKKDLFVSTEKSSTFIPRFYPPSLDKEELNQSIGHGTDVLSMTQYHTLLGFRLYGFKLKKEGMIPGIVTLLDIKPTLLELLHLPYIHASGRSLVKLIKGERRTLPNQHIFLESDFTPEAIRTVYPETRKVLLEGIQFFQINHETTQLTVKDTMGKMIINSKQFADIYGEWILALYPQNSHIRMPILVNLTTGEWTNDLQSEFAKASPAYVMLEKLNSFYGEEITTI